MFYAKYIFVDDGADTEWFALEQNEAIKATMDSPDFTENLEKWDQLPQKPAWFTSVHRVGLSRALR